MRQKYIRFYTSLILFLLCINAYTLFSSLLTHNTVTYYTGNSQNKLDSSNGNNLIFKVGTISEPVTIELVEAWDRGSNNVISQVVETLFAYNLSDPSLPRVNRLAQSYLWINSTTLQIQLRQGILFHDGTPFNASAAKWNFDRLLYLTNCTGTNTGTVALTQSLWMFPDSNTPIIKSVSTVDNWNITITLNAPYAPLMDLLCYVNAGMISPTSTPATQFIDLSSGQLIGTGPFQYEYYISGIEVYFTRWDNYWRDPAYFEEMYYLFFPSTDDLHYALLAHTIDYSQNPLYMNFPSYDADPQITVKRYSEDTGIAGLFYNHVGFNNLLFNITWRKVMSLAINYSYIIDVMQYGNAVRANSPISPGFGESYNTSATAADYDLSAARALMQSMGYGTAFTTDAEWIAVAEGPSPFLTVNYTYNTGNLFREQLFYALNNWYKLIGINVVENALSWANVVNLLFYDHEHLGIYALTWGPDYLNPFTMLYPLIDPSSDVNSAQIDDPWLNMQMEDVVITTDETARNNIYKNIQWYMAEVGYFHAYLSHPSVFFVHLTEIEGVPYNGADLFYAYPIYRAVPGPFSLTTNAGIPDDDGNFDLNWTISEGANNYSVYESSSYISTLNGSLTLLASEITDVNLSLSGYLDGTYYFIVVAHNNYGYTLSNCISVLVAVIYDHDLKVSLQLPASVEINSSYIVNATVINNGINVETSVQLYLYLDRLEVNSTTIPTLLVGQGSTIQYNWTPSAYKSYNFTTYAPPVPLESYMGNNIKTIVLYLLEPNFLDGLYIKHRFGQVGTFYETTFSYTPYTGGLYNESFDVGGMGSYVWQVDPTTRIMSGMAIFGDGAHTPAWIFTNTSLYDIIPIGVDGEGDHNFYVARELIYDLPGFGFVNVWELEDLTEPGGFAWYEKSTGILLNGTFSYGGGLSYYIFEFIDTNANFQYIIYDHEIIVTLDVPSIVELDNTYLINATVENNGLYDELGVSLFLYIDTILVNSTTIANLMVGTSQTIQYLWTPTEYRAYNFTAIAPAVPSESYTDNNRKTIYRYIIDTKLFDGLFIKHQFILGDLYTTNTTYSNYDGRLFYEKWNLHYMGMLIGTYTWMVDAETRVMAGASPFGEGAHSPMWIFTSVSLYDTVPIGVFMEGDHNFSVARELIYNLPGVGPVGVWELEDLSYPGGVVWYEKSTGILLNGTFAYSGGMSSYQFVFIDTNAPIETVSGNLPGDFLLSSNAESPDLDGNFDLSWTSSSDAVSYSIYRYSGLITEINGSLTLLADDIVVLSMALNNYADGTYYIIVVAHNIFGDTLSNCISITVSREVTPPGIPGYDGLLILASLGIAIALIIKKKYNRK